MCIAKKVCDHKMARRVRARRARVLRPAEQVRGESVHLRDACRRVRLRVRREWYKVKHNAEVFVSAEVSYGTRDGRLSGRRAGRQRHWGVRRGVVAGRGVPIDWGAEHIRRNRRHELAASAAALQPSSSCTRAASTLSRCRTSCSAASATVVTAGSVACTCAAAKPTPARSRRA